MTTLSERLALVAAERTQLAMPSTGVTFALVVQGGGMRGVYSMGALQALQDRNLQPAFDLAVGSSAGAINCAYLLAGQAEVAVSIYIEHLTNKSFLNFRRVNKIVDVDFMIDEVVKKTCALNVQAVYDSGTALEIVVTDAVTAMPVTFSAKDASVDLYELLRATAALPVIYNRRISLNGHTYIDGGFSDAIPLGNAVKTKPSDIVVITTRAPRFRRDAESWWLRRLTKLAAFGQSRAVKARLGEQDDLFNATMQLLANPLVENSKLWTVWPSDLSKLVGRTTSDRALVRQCAEMGYSDMIAELDHPQQDAG